MKFVLQYISRTMTKFNEIVSLIASNYEFVMKCSRDETPRSIESSYILRRPFYSQIH